MKSTKNVEKMNVIAHYTGKYTIDHGDVSAAIIKIK